MAEFKAIVENVRSQKFSDTAAEAAVLLNFSDSQAWDREASALTWSDVDLDRSQLILFRQKTKTGFPVPIYPQLAAAIKRAGFAGYSPRSFRRLFITKAIESGVDVKTIAQWQGHSDGGKLILDTYSHVRPEHSDRMAKLIA